MLSALPLWIENYLDLWIAAAIVVLGLLVYGFGDLLRFSPRRVSAISGVVFDESIRRRVLWITPLAIVGVIIVSQLQKAIDEQDAIRQTIKFSLFAAGMLVTITAIILACTNLPREIDSRVIYTVVTKPTTRLEIIVGKVLGFAYVSAAILLIMGAFTFAYLHLRAWSMRSDIERRLAAGAVETVSRPTLEYWAQAGLLTSRTFENPDALEIFARPPQPNDPRRWFFGSGEGEMAVPFKVTPEQLLPAGVPDAAPGAAGVLIHLNIGFDKSEYGKEAPPAEPPLPVGVAAPSSLPATAPAGAPPRSASIAVQIMDEHLNTLIDSRVINKGEPIILTDPTGRTPALAYIPPDAAPNLMTRPFFFVHVSGLTGGVEYFVNVDGQTGGSAEASPADNPVFLIVPGATPEMSHAIAPMPNPADPAHQASMPLFRARSGTYGQQLRGGPPDRSPLAVYRFRDAAPRSSDNGVVGFELRTGIERSGDEADETAEATRLEISVQDRTGQTLAGPLAIFPENSRTTYFSLPASALASGDFDLVIRNLTDGHYVGLEKASLAMVSSEESFNWNLIKSLLILWMLSILVVIISIFSSTFLSWPIAIVLTLVILLGHWGVVQLGDATAPGIGNVVATDLGFQDPSKAKVISASVEALSRLLNNVAKVLPDISRFSAVEDIERGITIHAPRIYEPLLVIAIFGLPLVVLSYIFLRNKEVAP